MNAITPGAKVYYLPTAEPIGDPPRPSRWTLARRRLVRAWWRMRLTVADLRIVRRRRRRRHDDALLFDPTFEESPALLIDRRPRKPVGPATILDFEAGRLRLRRSTA